MQVARAGRVVSDTVVFEYKAGPVLAPSSPASAPLPSLDFRRFSLLQRLQRLHGRLQLKTEPMDENNQVGYNSKRNNVLYLIYVCFCIHKITEDFKYISLVS